MAQSGFSFLLTMLLLGGLALNDRLVVVDNRRRRRIRDGNVIVAVEFAHASGQSAAHRHPIEKFDAL